MTMTAPTVSPAERARRLEITRNGLRKALAAHALRLDRLAFEPDGALVVEGEAESVAAKKRALRLAAILSNAPGIADRLHVRPGGAATDDQIRDHLLDLYTLDPRFAGLEARPGDGGARGIGVSVQDGVVTLNGETTGLVSKRLAGVIAWRASGVRDVINGLAVEPPEEDGPDQLEEAVREALDGHPLFDDTQVKVGVFGDAVRLTGLVHTEDARRAAEEEAWRVLGVDEVINEIAVSA
ncbi:BON domain-containing protein [Phenylobacterium sp.]|uniref:BON domain-containing protein n=1 Tax=Phenylobacterium sp. TaxID=1871053 RepID=UPI00391A4DC0